jgi:hypothetical protein
MNYTMLIVHTLSVITLRVIVPSEELSQGTLTERKGYVHLTSSFLQALKISGRYYSEAPIENYTRRKTAILKRNWCMEVNCREASVSVSYPWLSSFSCKVNHCVL